MKKWTFWTASFLLVTASAFAGDPLTIPLFCTMDGGANALGTTHSFYVSSSGPARAVQVVIQSSGGPSVTVPNSTALLAGYWDDTSGVKLLTYDPSIKDLKANVNFKLKVSFKSGATTAKSDAPACPGTAPQPAPGAPSAPAAPAGPNVYTGSLNFGFGPADNPTDFDSGALTCQCVQLDGQSQPVKDASGNYKTTSCPDLGKKSE